MNKITTLVAGVKNVSVDGWDSLKTIAQFLNFIMHPGLIIHALWTYTLAYAFWICLIVALFSAVFYAFGFKKCLKFIPGSMAIYTLIRMIGSAV